MDKLAFLPLYFVPFIFSLSFHEAAHAWMADRRGDPTARMLGRMTLNPIPHIDILGTLILPMMSFLTGAPLIGWARPVPVNERNLRHWRRDGLLVAAAGPLSNLVLSVAFAGMLAGLSRVNTLFPSAAFVEVTQAGFKVMEPLVTMAIVGIQLNIILAFFNLIPIPPLDGGRVAMSLFPGIANYLAALERYGIIILWGLLAFGGLSRVIFQPAWSLAEILIRWAG